MRKGGHNPGHRENGDPETSELIKDLQQRLELYKLIFNSIHNGAIVTDAAGYVTHFNQPYGRFLDSCGEPPVTWERADTLEAHPQVGNVEKQKIAQE